MPNFRSRAMVTIGTGVSALALAAPTYGAPLPAFCQPSMVVDNVCTARLTSVTANAIDGTITGAPVGGGAAITLAGPLDAYRMSAGFGDAPPEAIQRWDTEIERAGALNVDPNDPNWYGNAKSVAFLPRTLNDLATQFPPDTLTVGFTADDAQPGTYQLVSIQPTPR